MLWHWLPPVTALIRILPDRWQAVISHSACVFQPEVVWRLFPITFQISEGSSIARINVC